MRPPIPDKVAPPYPIRYENRIIIGFGRGSSELGIPTANVPVDDRLNILDPGIYFGWCRVSPSDTVSRVEHCDHHRGVTFNYGRELVPSERVCLPMVMSIGWNPFYHNKEKAAEIHVIYKFEQNFYGANVNLAILGYIRPELDYTTKEALIEDMMLDINTAKAALQRSEYKVYEHLVEL